MKRWIVLSFLSVIFKIHCWEFVCPNGCGSSSDLDVQHAGSIFLNCLEQIGLLKQTVIIFSDEESGRYEEEFTGKDWILLWHAEHDCDIEFPEDDDDEDLDPIRTDNYLFSR